MTIEERWQEYERLLSITDWDYRMPVCIGRGRQKKYRGLTKDELATHRAHFDLLRGYKRDLERRDPERARALYLKYYRRT